MANNTILVEEKSTRIGEFMVGRYLPFRKKRQVGPFTFIYHMGPSVLDGTYIDVDQHPHIGLSTLTYLLEGEVEHRDSTGAVQVISEGDVGFMTAGKGVTHTERTPKQRRGGKLRMHGYQIWIALPKEKEEMDPRFDFVPSSDLPNCEYEGFRIKVIAGEAFGLKSPLAVHSKLFMFDLYAEERNTLKLNGLLEGEIAFIVTKGRVLIGEEMIEQGQMLISTTRDQCEITVDTDTKLLIFGGEPLPEERFLYWNFVSSSRDRLEQAKIDWQEKRFPKVPGDESYISIP